MSTDFLLKYFFCHFHPRFLTSILRLHLNTSIFFLFSFFVELFGGCGLVGGVRVKMYLIITEYNKAC